MLWDRGTWTPEADDVDAALKKGDLKFTLDGYKLKGSWVLVRTSGRYRRRQAAATAIDLAAHQASRRLGRRARHHRVRAEEREERRRLRGHSRRRHAGDLDHQQLPRRRWATTPARCWPRSSSGGHARRGRGRHRGTRQRHETSNEEPYSEEPDASGQDESQTLDLRPSCRRAAAVGERTLQTA